MNLAVDTADLATISKSPWAVSLVLAGILAAVMWVIIERVVTREDEILAQGAALHTEFAESRLEIAAGLTTLQQVMAASDAAMSQRAERWIATPGPLEPHRRRPVLRASQRQRRCSKRM